jgi:hypothetical protein
MTKELDAPLKTAHGEDDPQFFHIGSALVVAAALPLAFGIAADIAVMFYGVSHDAVLSSMAGAAAFTTLIMAWYVFPLTHRGAQHG